MQRNGFEITLEYIGEGWSGDYDPDNSGDDRLLRLTIMNDDEEHSCCTAMTDALTEEVQESVLLFVANSCLGTTDVVKTRVLETLSWLNDQEAMLVHQLIEIGWGTLAIL